MVFFGGNSLWQLVQQSDFISQLVLFILLILSIICWTYFLGKLFSIRLHKNNIEKTATQFSFDISLKTILTYSNNMVDACGISFVRHVAIFIQHIVKLRGEYGIISHADAEIIIEYIYQLLDEIVESEKSTASLLSTVAGVAPLLGLFGTVWGLVHAFMRISQQQSADIVTVAPGIAEALITTLAGLMVAIPALIMFNYIQIQLRAMEVALQNLADRLKIIVQSASILKDK